VPDFDQPHSLKLELAGKLPSLHDPPPVPLKYLTRCLRHRVQAKWASIAEKGEFTAPEHSVFGTAVEVRYIHEIVSRFRHESNDFRD
jgi:hypothetical protein